MRSTVYFLSDQELCRVKIGKTSAGKSCHPNRAGMYRRIHDIMAMSPSLLLLVAEVEGYSSVERYFHKEFERNKLHGEWFVVDHALADMILNIQNSGRKASRKICPGSYMLDAKREKDDTGLQEKFKTLDNFRRVNFKEHAQ